MKATLEEAGAVWCLECSQNWKIGLGRSLSCVGHLKVLVAFLFLD